MADIRLQGLIENACKPTTQRFDLTLGKQICELVNEKQGSFPRLAALKIAKLVISKNAQQAMHALSLLNLCVLECGFPFHLQMSTNEFINEITKRTPLIPYHNIAPAETRKPKESTEHTWNHFDYIPTQPSTSDRVNERLLYMIKEWAIAFQHDTLYREDMERLVKLYHCLKQFNYPFPDVSDSPLVESFTSPKLLTPDEMLEKAKMYLTTKFHEYVRRSKSPDDENTRIANALLKCIITDEKHQQAFTKFKEELFPQMVRGIKCKAIVLYEQLEAMKPDDKIDKPMKDLQKVLCNARTKIKRMLADKNLDLRDLVVPLDALIDKVLAKYSDVEQGIYNTSYDIFNKNQVQETSTTTFGSLIDLEDQSLPVNTMPSPPVETKPSFDVDIPLSRIVTLLDKNGLQIHLEIYENSNDNSMKLKALYSNQSIAPMEDMNLSITATNASSITMEPASSSVIRPKSVKTVHQNIILSNVKERQLCCSYRVTYYQLGVLMEQSGEYQENL